MPLFHAIILGVIQGLTEVLPISSSAHLVLMPWLFGWSYQGISFDIALHVGTAMAFGIYFFKDWLDILRKAFAKERSKKSPLLWYLAAGTIPAAFAGLLLEEQAETVFRSIPLIMAMLIIFAVILWIADHRGKRDKTIDNMNLKTALVVGLAQALALIPGVSRSGITITAGLFEGFSREAAARFSFLLATPIVFAAAALKLTKLQAAYFDAAFWTGVISSAVSGFIAIHLLLKLVRRSSLNIFVFYRIIFAIIMLVLFVTGVKA